MTSPSTTKLVKAPAQFMTVELETHVNDLVKQGCNTDQDFIEFGEVIAKIDSSIKAINATSDELQQPFRDSKKTIEDSRKKVAAKFSTMIAPFSELRESIVDEYERFVVARKEKADKEEQERQAKLKAEEEARVANLKEDVEADPFNTRVVTEQPIEVKTKKVIAPNVRTPDATVSTSFLAALEIIDKAKVPEEYKVVDESALLKAYRKNKKLIVAGVRFYEKPSTSSKG